MQKIRIGTRESQLAIWQAKHVQQMLLQQGFSSELVFIKSEGDLDLITPLYAIGVQGIFTKALDAALLNLNIDIAVHSMKDVPIQLAEGVAQAAILKRASYNDLWVGNHAHPIHQHQLTAPPHEITPANWLLATSSIRRKAQWLHRYPHSVIENIRGNVNTRLQKLQQSNWQGAIFAAAGLERIGLRPANAVALHWMLPAPAQGAIMVVCRKDDEALQKKCLLLQDKNTAICTTIERDFLATLQGGCATPISALAEIEGGLLHFKGNILSPNGKQKVEIAYEGVQVEKAQELGLKAGLEILLKGGDKLMKEIQHAAK